MDLRRLDASLRALRTRATRRRALAAALAVLLGGAAGDPARAKKKPGKPKKKCGKDSCRGCCENGACRKGTDAAACGKGGGRCARCGGGSRCAKGRCTAPAACGPATCPNGCCDGGRCLPGTAQAACGADGAACAACGGAMPLCKAGACAAGTWTLQQTLATGAPTGIALSADGLELYASELLNNRIARWTRATGSEPWTAQSPIGNGTGDLATQFANPQGVMLSANGLQLFVPQAVNARIKQWYRASIGGQWLGKSQLVTSATSDPVPSPMALALSGDRREMYIADSASNKISIWLRETEGALDYHKPFAVLGDSQPASGTGAGSFNAPTGVALSADGLELYVADRGNYRISWWKRASGSGPWQAQPPLGAGNGAARDQFGLLEAVAVSADLRTLYIADGSNRRIACWSRSAPGAAWTAQDPLAFGGSGSFTLPSDVAVSADGMEVFVADQLGNTVTTWRRT